MTKSYEPEPGGEGVFAEAPEGPGVYIIRDGRGSYLYIGKSRSIRKRLADHLHAARQGVEKEALIVGAAARAEYMLTKNEIEALILENNLIKRHRPRYNIVLRDDKTYPYLRLDPREDFPRLTVTRRRREDGAVYFGPYVSVKPMRRTLHYIGGLFPLRKCEDEKLPKRARPCLNFGIGRCLGPCAGKISPEAYREVADELILFLKGGHQTLRKRLEKKMSDAAEDQRYEEAARIRDRLREMEQVFQRQDIFGRAIPTADVLGLARGAAGWSVYVLFVRDGHVVGGEGHYLKAPWGASEEEVVQSFLEGYYSSRREVPVRVVIPVDLPERVLLEEYLAGRAGRKVELAVAARGRGLELLLLARRNALSLLAKKERRRGGPEASLWAGVMPGGRAPGRIEVYDASSLHGREAVVGMVLWEKGAFRKGGYRRFRVKTALGSDDYASIREAVGRRLARIGKGEEKAPDLILVDGGAGHVGAVREVLARAGSGTPLLGIAKGARRREGDRLHAAGGRALELPPDAPLVRFLGALRDEVHRWAVAYHRQRRGAAMKASSLDGIPGLGARRKAILVNYLGSPGAAAKADLDELLAVPGLPAEVARAVHRRFHPA